MTRPIGNPASSKKSVPDAPAFPGLSNNGTGRAFNNGRVDVILSSAFDGKLPITQYVVTPSPATTPATFSSATSSVTVTNLLSATAYSFSAVATNGVGPSAASSTLPTTVTATTVPQIPSSVTGIGTRFAAFGSAPQVSLTIVNGANGGSVLTNTEYSTNSGTNYFATGGTGGGLSVVSKQSNNTDFVAGGSYSFLVRTVNANGFGQSFSVSPVQVGTVPQAPTITGVTRVSNTQASIAFNPNNNGGFSLSGVTFTSSPSVGLSWSGTTSPITVTGSFVLNQSYTFTMTSTNYAGTSLSSSASAGLVVNPSVAPNFVAPNFPNFVAPNFPNFVAPNFPNFVAPNFPNFVAPNFPNFVAPNFPNFVAPNFPNFVAPNFPNFVAPSFTPTPNFPNFVAPNFPNFVAPNFTGCANPCPPGQFGCQDGGALCFE
jgi:hypothetical protein